MLHVGVDLHKRFSQVAVLDEEGEIGVSLPLKQTFPRQTASGTVRLPHRRPPASQPPARSCERTSDTSDGSPGTS